MKEHEYGVLHLFAGIGGGAIGFQRATAEWNGIAGTFRTLGGVDVDHDACLDFERLTGVRATEMDLFGRDDYMAFHGHEPPEGWREATPEDIRRASGGIRPDVIFTSPPCKGLSALLPGASASSPKYQALNRLTVRGIALALAAWSEDPPGLIVFEKVPRFTSRGKPLLADIKRLLRSAGYVVATPDNTIHDMGEIGGLSQHRKRFLLVARHPKFVPALLYQPPKRRVRAIGEELGTLPMPDDADGGPMHRLPRLNWLTWVRLALIPAGGDWRDLQKIEPESYRIVPSETYFHHSYGVKSWDEPAATVTTSSSPSSGAVTVADHRLGHMPRKGVFRVARWDKPADTVIASARPSGSNGVASVADPRFASKEGRHTAHFHVTGWEDAGRTVTGATHVANGIQSVADPRVSGKRGETFNGSPGLLGVMDWANPSATVTGTMRAASSNAPASVADPRVGSGYSNKHRVLDWQEPATTVTGMTDVQEGAQSIADPRLTCSPHSGAYRVTAWDESASTVTASGDVHAQGASCVADPRLPGPNESGAWVIVAEDGTWHRPLTTYELAMLQGFPRTMPDGSPFCLVGRSHTKWRERIGNAVPPPAAQGVAEMMLATLIASTEGVWLMSVWLTNVWVAAVWRWERVKRLRARIGREGRS